MARLLYITTGLSGGLNTSLEIARRVVAAGHEISFLGHRPLADRLGTEGYRYHQLVADTEAIDVLREAVDRVGRLRSARLAHQLRQGLVASREVEDAVRSRTPDALLIDVEAHYAIIATQRLGIPRLLKSDWFSMTRRRGIPPLNSPLSLPATPRGRAEADLAWALVLAHRLADNTIKQLHPRQLVRRFAPFRYDTISRPDLRAVAKARGLNLRSFTSQTQWLRPHVYPDIPMISVTSAGLDFGHETNRNVVSVGAMTYRSRRELKQFERDTKRWQQFRDQNQARNCPLIYCTFGTMNANTERLIATVVEGFRARPDIDLVIGRGSVAPASVTVTEAANVLILDYAPQVDVLAVADAAIHHGGINTINECIGAGVPMLVLWSNLVDQPGGAARVAHHGVAKAAEAATSTPGQIGGLVDALLADADIRAAAVAAQREMERTAEEQTLEHVVERLLAGRL